MIILPTLQTTIIIMRLVSDSELLLELEYTVFTNMVELLSVVVVPGTTGAITNKEVNV